MNNGKLESPLAERSATLAGIPTRSFANSEELAQLKRELLQAEVRLAKARATIAGAEVDVKVLNTRLKALAK